jgi:hypothetical protein
VLPKEFCVLGEKRIRCRRKGGFYILYLLLVEIPTKVRGNSEIIFVILMVNVIHLRPILIPSDRFPELGDRDIGVTCQLFLVPFRGARSRSGSKRTHGFVPFLF